MLGAKLNIVGRLISVVLFNAGQAKDEAIVWVVEEAEQSMLGAILVFEMYHIIVIFDRAGFRAPPVEPRLRFEMA
ncbi:hypothetical protein P608_24890 [Comamonas thiooxydans]|uniref:Uncharacterized protein n=1 Tax=Comamonas thiooxydans TaxID=363952 RepID=A0A0E3BNA7_9BURK|nr:hypothetical protein P608_24890 [Comamonas thiooxydans]KGH17666.1 hypothetical protein P606_26145 [Comamonas thiooxydans]KGH27962.1 hypothetical protein P607_02990 [Comamonas thiooxydans]